MFLHRKELLHPVNVGKPDARFGTFLLEQFGGATGELTAVLLILGAIVPRRERRHPRHAAGHRDRGIRPPPEMVGQNPLCSTPARLDQTAVYDAPLFCIQGGGPHFLDSQGSCWTAAYINEGGNVVRDLRAHTSPPRPAGGSPMRR